MEAEAGMQSLWESCLQEIVVCFLPAPSERFLTFSGGAACSALVAGASFPLGKISNSSTALQHM